MDQFYTEELMHAFGHIEIPTTNLQKSKKFFGTVFGWTFSHIQDIDYTIIHTGKHPNGGFEIVKRHSVYRSGRHRYNIESHTKSTRQSVDEEIPGRFDGLAVAV
jgi:predicted enzyme related to lactoylglutathione lyase